MTRARDLSEIVNSTGLSVDTDTLVVDSANNRVGIGTNDPNTLTHIYGGTSGRAWSVDANDVIALENDNSAAFDIRTPNASQGLILFSDSDARAQGIVGYSHNNDFMYFNTNGAERMRIDSNGQVGIGYTPDAWSTSLDVIQLGTARGSSVVAGNSGYSVNNHLFMTNNGYAGNEWYYTNNTTAIQYYLEGTGNHIWNYAAAGVVGETTTIVSGRKYEITSGVPSPDLTGFGAATNNVGEVFIATGNTTITGGAVTQAILWNEAMRIDTAGNLLVGKTSSDLTTDGFEVRPTGFVGVRTNGDPLYLNRKSTDGVIATFAQDGIPVGSIASSGGGVHFNGVGLGLRMSGTAITSTDGGTGIEDATRDLGTSAARFKDLYLSGGVKFGTAGVTSGTGTEGTDGNNLDDYEEGTFTPSLEFGGASTGITYQAASQVGIYTKVGNLVHISIEIRLTSKGTSTGTMTVTGLPFTGGGTSLDWQSLSCANFANFTNLNSAPAPSIGFGSAGITIRHLGASDGTATGDDLLDDTNATNTLILGITGTYIAT